MPPCSKPPLSFDISINEILLPLVSGGRLVIAKPEGERDPQYLLDLIAGESVTFVYLVSSMLDILLDLANGTDQLDSLKHVWCGGEVLTPELFDRFRDQLSTTLYHGYGPAEATIGVSHVIYREEAERIATSIGRPNPQHSSVRVGRRLAAGSDRHRRRTLRRGLPAGTRIRGCFGTDRISFCRGSLRLR